MQGDRPCPVCGKYMFGIEGQCDICDFCGWEDFPLEEPDLDFGCWGMSSVDALAAAKKKYESLLKIKPNFKWSKDFRWLAKYKRSNEKI